ncbi:MAG: hypothetical protein JNM76_12640 [Betaproteobacteria bacterium]|nr:hypothetical protein [Betaproteobacteria bacterium]
MNPIRMYFKLDRSALHVAAALAIIFPASAAAQAARPVIDGSIDREEWKGAQRHALIGGGELLILRQADELFVAVRGGARGLASLCIGNKDQVEVLHASAALGTAVYSRHDRSWLRGTAFDWKVRDRAALADQLAAERESYFAEHQWIANASSTESPDREFHIRLNSNRRQLGVAFFDTATKGASHWPADAADSCVDSELLRGEAPKLLKFNPWRWYELK